MARLRAVEWGTRIDWDGWRGGAAGRKRHAFGLLVPVMVLVVSFRTAHQATHHSYLCCNGDWPCSGRCGEQSCPQCCLATEVVVCFPQSVASTRWMLQDEMRLRNTECDNCIIGTMFAAQYLACLCWVG